MVGKMVPVPCKSNGKEKEFEYYFLRNCRNWNLVKKKSENLSQIKNSSKICTDNENNVFDIH